MIFSTIGFLRFVMIVIIFSLSAQAFLQYKDTFKFNELENKIITLQKVRAQNHYRHLNELREQQDVLMYISKKLESSGSFDKEMMDKLTHVIDDTDYQIHLYNKVLNSMEKGL